MIHNQSHDGRTVVSVIAQYEILTRLVGLVHSRLSLDNLLVLAMTFTRSEITSIFYVWYVVYFCQFALPFQSTSSLLHMEQIPTVQNMFSLPRGAESNRKCTFYFLHVEFVQSYNFLLHFCSGVIFYNQCLLFVIFLKKKQHLDIGCVVFKANQEKQMALTSNTQFTKLNYYCVI